MAPLRVSIAKMWGWTPWAFHVVEVVFFLLCNEVFHLCCFKKNSNICIYTWSNNQWNGHGVGSTTFPILVTNVVRFLVLKKHLVATILLKMWWTSCLITITLQTSEVYGYSCNQFLSSPLVVDATFGFEGGECPLWSSWLGCLLCVQCLWASNQVHPWLNGIFGCDLGIGIVCQEFNLGWIETPFCFPLWNYLLLATLTMQNSHFFVDTKS
jgi:hypothetical protein